MVEKMDAKILLNPHLIAFSRKIISTVCGVLFATMALSTTASANCNTFNFNSPDLKRAISAAIKWKRDKSKDNINNIIAQSRPIVHFGGIRKNHKDAIVYLTGSKYCGSGGCQLLIFSDTPKYRLVSRIFSVQYPIVSLSPKAASFSDIGVGVYGGGLEVSSQLAKLTPKDSVYPNNPTLSSIPKISPNDPGLVTLISKNGKSSQCLLE